MNRIALYFFMLSLLAVSCREDEDYILGRPDVRSEALLAQYKEQLVSSPHGWNAYLYPGLGGGFSFMMEFTEEGRVTMMSDINRDCASVPFESSYRMQAVQRPSLFFDTYSYIHILADPDPDTLGGVIGQGYFSDFEFSFVSGNEDTLHLKGNFNGSELLLIKATAEQKTKYLSGDVNNMIKDVNRTVEENQFLYVDFNGSDPLGIIIDYRQKLMGAFYREGNELISTYAAFAYTAQGIFLQQEIVHEGESFREIFYDAETAQLYVVSDGVRYNLETAAQPMFPLSLSLGTMFSTISIPPKPGFTGWSPSFQSNWNYMATGFWSCCRLGTSDMNLQFSKENSTMTLDIYVISVDTGIKYVLRYYFNYSINSNGVIRFAPAGSPNANGMYFEVLVRPILDRLEQDRFFPDYVKGDEGYVGQLRSLDTPDYTLAGELE
jgi:hypothetical protein